MIISLSDQQPLSIIFEKYIISKEHYLKETIWPAFSWFKPYMQSILLKFSCIWVMRRLTQALWFYQVYTQFLRVSGWELVSRLQSGNAERYFELLFRYHIFNLEIKQHFRANTFFHTSYFSIQKSVKAIRSYLHGMPCMSHTYTLEHLKSVTAAERKCQGS